jgi:PqqA peptide cyclase
MGSLGKLQHIIFTVNHLIKISGKGDSVIYRAEPKALMIFNSESGITAILSDNELSILEKNLNDGYENEFIDRLLAHGLLQSELTADEKLEVLGTIERSRHIEAPLRSFAVPESLHIDLTTECPLHCSQCYKDSSKMKTMSYEVFSKKIEEAKEMKVFQIALGGGEPLLVNGLSSYVKKVKSCEMACTITTSGYGLTHAFMEELRESGVNHIQISLNGSTKEINAHSRDGFDHAISSLHILSESGILFGINWVARMDNVYDFKNVVDIAMKVKADHINILRYKPTIKESYEKNVLTLKAYLFLKEEIRKIKGLKIKVDSAFSNMLCDLHKNQSKPLNSGCGAGRRFMTMDPFGRFKACSHLSDIEEGKSLSDYWKNSESLLKLRKGEENILEDCKFCEHFYDCRGCRAICESIYKNINAGEKDCPAFSKKE